MPLLTQAAVGSHRLWASDILVFLLLPSHTTIDRLVAQAQLLPRVVHLALTHDTCNTLHSRLPQLLRCAVGSRVMELWEPLFQQGFGGGLEDEGGEGQCKPIHMWLASIGRWDPCWDGGRALGNRYLNWRC